MGKIIWTTQNHLKDASIQRAKPLTGLLRPWKPSMADVTVASGSHWQQVELSECGWPQSKFNTVPTSRTSPAGGRPRMQQVVSACEKRNQAGQNLPRLQSLLRQPQHAMTAADVFVCVAACRLVLCTLGRRWWPPSLSPTSATRQRTRQRQSASVPWADCHRRPCTSEAWRRKAC